MLQNRMFVSNPLRPTAISNSYCLEYYGTNGYVSIGRPSNLDFNPQTDSFTISLWFRPTTADFQRCLLAKALMDPASGGDVTVFLGIQSNAIYCLVGRRRKYVWW